MNLYLERLMRTLTLAELLDLAERLPCDEQDSLGRAWAEAMTATIGRDRLHELLARLVFGAPSAPPPSAPSAQSAPSAPPPSAPSAPAPKRRGRPQRRGRPPKVRDVDAQPPRRRGRPPKVRTEAAQVVHEPESLALFEPGTEPEPLDGSEPEPEPEPIGPISLEDERAGLLMLRQAIAAYDYEGDEPADAEELAGVASNAIRSYEPRELWQVRRNEHNERACEWLEARGIVETHRVNGTGVVVALSPLAELAYVRGLLAEIGGAVDVGARYRSGLFAQFEGDITDRDALRAGALLRSINLARRDCERLGQPFQGIALGELLRDREAAPVLRAMLAQGALELVGAHSGGRHPVRVRLPGRPFLAARREAATAWPLVAELFHGLLAAGDAWRSAEYFLPDQASVDAGAKLEAWGLASLRPDPGSGQQATATLVAWRVYARTEGRAFVVDYPARIFDRDRILGAAVRAGLVPTADALSCAVGSVSLSAWIEREQDHAVAWQSSPVGEPPAFIEGAIVRTLGARGCVPGGRVLELAELARATAYGHRAMQTACEALEARGLLTRHSRHAGEVCCWALSIRGAYGGQTPAKDAVLLAMVDRTCTVEALAAEQDWDLLGTAEAVRQLIQAGRLCKVPASEGLVTLAEVQP